MPVSENGLRQDSQNETKNRKTKSDRFVVYGRTKKAHSVVEKTLRARDVEVDPGVRASSEKKPFNHVTN